MTKGAAGPCPTAPSSLGQSQIQGSETPGGSPTPKMAYIQSHTPQNWR